MIIAGDGYAYLTYKTLDIKASVKRSTSQRYTDAAYDIFDHLNYDLGDQDRPADFGTAIADLEALWQEIGHPYAPGDFLLGALQNHDRNLAINRLNDLAQDFRRPCDHAGSSVTKLHLLRVASDGSSSDIIVKDWSENHSDVITSSATVAYHSTRTQTGPREVQFSASHLITNADTGALVSWQAWKDCDDDVQTDSSCVSYVVEHHLSTSNGDAVSDVVWNPGVGSGEIVQPVLQLDDGSFAGNVQTNAGNVVVVFDASGEIKWTLAGYRPKIATADGGLIASTDEGNSYVFDGDGNATGQLGSLPIESWRGNSYQYGSVDQFASLPSRTSGISRWPYSGGYQSGQGTAKPPTYALFIPVDPLKDTVPVYTTSQFKADVNNQSAMRAIATFYVHPAANAFDFERAIANTQNSMVAFVGHAIPGDNVSGSVGLSFSDYGIVKNNPTYIDARGLPFTIYKDKLVTKVKVVFIASCWVADLFKSLWDIDQDTPGRSLIVPLGNATSQADLYWAALAWQQIAISLSPVGTTGKSVFQAVKDANDWLASYHANLQFTVIGGQGGRDVRIR
jgi:hypothetical protein